MGVFLLVAAFVVPALVLRETGVLRISEQELSTLTPLARKEVERRQGVERAAGVAAPYVGVLFLLVGGTLLVYGVPRLKRKEHADERRFSVELAKLEAEIEPQSEAEREERLKADAEEELAEEIDEAGGTEAARTLAEDDSSEQPNDIRGLMQRAAVVERKVLDRLAQIAPPDYVLQANVKVAGGPLLDGLLISRIPNRPDIVVEIKMMRANIRKNLVNRFNDGLGVLLRYRAEVQRAAIGWLILVIDGEANADERYFAKRRAEEYGAGLRISIITIDELPGMSLPDDA